MILAAKFPLLWIVGSHPHIGIRDLEQQKPKGEYISIRQRDPRELCLPGKLNLYLPNERACLLLATKEGMVQPGLRALTAGKATLQYLASQKWGASGLHLVMTLRDPLLY